jgi:hypothetical protein
MRMIKQAAVLTSTAIVFLSCGIASAQSELEKLIEQTGIEVGSIAMRDMLGWRAPKKIVVYGGFDIDDDLQGTVPGAYFVNVGRGKSVVTDDLIAALRSGKIAGAGLDVTNPEPLPSDNALWQMNNVIITPNVSSNGGNSIRNMIVLRENLRRFVAGEALLNVVDPELGY